MNQISLISSTIQEQMKFNHIKIYIFLISFIPVVTGIMGIDFFKHDTLSEFENFCFFANSFVQFNEFPLWNPYVKFGMSTGIYELYSIGPAQLLAIFIKYLFKIDNNFLLYLFSIVLNIYVFLIGIYLLIIDIYKSIEPKKILPIFLVFSMLINIFIQINFELLSFNLLPLGLWLIHKSIISNHNSNKIYYFIMFIHLNTVQMLFGRTTYFVFFNYYIIGLSIILLVILNNVIVVNKNQLDEQSWTYEWKLFILASVLLLSASLTIHHFIKIALFFNENYSVVSNGRNINGSVSFTNFISYGGYENISKFKSILIQKGLTFDFDLFLGITVSSLAIVGLIEFAKSPVLNSLQIVIVALIIVLFIFVNPGEFKLFSWIIYQLPYMDRLRHLGYFSVLIKYFLASFSLICLIKNNNLKYLQNVALISIIISVYLLYQDLHLYKYYILYIIIQFTLLILTSHHQITLKKANCILFGVILVELFIHKFYFNEFNVIAKNISETEMLEKVNSKLKIEVIKNFIKLNTGDYDLKNGITYANNLIRFAKPEKNSDLVNYLNTVGSNISRYATEASFIDTKFCVDTSRNDLIQKNLINTLSFDKAKQELFFNESNCEKIYAEFLENSVGKKNEIYANQINFQVSDLKKIVIPKSILLLKNSFNSIEFEVSSIDGGVFRFIESKVPGRDIYVDNIQIKETIESPFYILNIPKGTHKIKIEFSKSAINEHLLYSLMTVVSYLYFFVLL